MPSRLPVLLNTVAASKEIVPALRFEKLSKRSIPTADELLDDPVESSCILPEPRWIPLEDVPGANEAVVVVVVVAIGIAPPLLTPTGAHGSDARNPFGHAAVSAISSKFSVKSPPDRKYGVWAIAELAAANRTAAILIGRVIIVGKRADLFRESFMVIDVLSSC